MMSAMPHAALVARVAGAQQPSSSARPEVSRAAPLAQRCASRAPCAPHAAPLSQRSARRARVALRVASVDAAPTAPASAPPGFFVDEEAMLAASAFPIAPDALIERCKAVLLANFGTAQPELLSPSFKFVAPVVGPLGKDEFVAAFRSFDILEAFPDMKFQYHHLRVDPFEPSRVWYTARAVGTHTGPFAKTLPATGKRVESPPQSCSMCFDEQGACTQLTVGYVMDRQLGNTGGLGAVFGILYAIGYPLPFPEAQPWSSSWQYTAFRTGSGVLQGLLKAIAPRP